MIIQVIRLIAEMLTLILLIIIGYATLMRYHLLSDPNKGGRYHLISSPNKGRNVWWLPPTYYIFAEMHL